MKRSFRLLAAAATALFASGIGIAAAQVVSTFDDPAIPVILGPNSHYFPQSTTTFMSGLGTFNHGYDTTYGSWGGWTYSNRSDTTTPGYSNQFSALPGGDADPANGGNYGLAYVDTFAPTIPAVTFTTPSTLGGAYFTNSTYAALSMLNGDQFAKKFGGPSGDDPDFFRLTITGIGAGSVPTGSIDFYLADYRFANNSQDYVVGTWSFVDLSSLGAVSRLEFRVASSDAGTPLYFALDNLSVTPVPEPTTVAMLLAGLAATIGVARRRRNA